MPFTFTKRRCPDIQLGGPGTEEVTFHLGGGLGSDGVNRYYILWKAGRMLVIQAKAAYCSSQEEGDPEYGRVLSNLQAMLETINFNQPAGESWAYLMPDEGTCGQGRLKYRHEPLGLRQECWSRKIAEDHIEVTRWGGAMHREGWWNGKEVDLCIPWISTWAGYADDLASGHRLMQSSGLKHLTFPMLGHIMRRGEVVGLLTEAAIGRGVEFSDRDAVIEAVTEMQRKGVIHRSLNPSNIFITDRGVRFMGISSVLHMKDDESLDEEAEEWHWEGLRRCFAELKPKVCNDAPTARKMCYPALVIPPLTSPTKPLLLPGMSQWSAMFALYLESEFRYYRWRQKNLSSFDDDSDTDSNVALYSQRRVSPPLILDMKFGRRRGSQEVELVSSESEGSTTGNRPHFRLRLRALHHPYRRESSRRDFRDDVTASSDTSDSTLS